MAAVGLPGGKEVTAPTWRDEFRAAGWRGALFLVGFAFCLTLWASPPIALGLGILLALAVGNPLAKRTSNASKLLLKASVVGLGFGIPVAKLLGSGATGVVFAIVTIAFALFLGIVLGRWLGVSRDTSWLISGGTAICGGSAIAAIGPAIKARAESMNVALATVFVLNSVALYLFPLVGHWAGLSQAQFGTWAALAIHDTSSVVGAGAAYGKEALDIATVTKLARAIWIAPLALGLAWWSARLARREGTQTGRAKLDIPWFILFFVLATVARALLPIAMPAFDVLARLAQVGLVATLFLIGAGLTRAALRAVGVRPFVQGVSLWIIVSVVAFAAVRLLVRA